MRKKGGSVPKSHGREKAFEVGMAAMIKNPDIMKDFAAENIRKLRAEVEIERHRQALIMAREIFGFPVGERITGQQAKELVELAGEIAAQIAERASR